MTKIEISEKILREVDKLAEVEKKTREEVISEALGEHISKHLYPYWREKRSLKKKKGEPWEGKIPESEYKPEQE